MPQSKLTSPVGTICVRTANGRLIAIAIGDDGHDDRDGDSEDVLSRAAAAQLAAWFAGRLSRFDLPLAPAKSPRGMVLRAALLAVGHGEMASYGEIARRVGSSARAVGQACARNPFPLVVPCHRIVGAGGALGHYSAGDGISTKRWLLAFERGLQPISGSSSCPPSQIILNAT